MINFASSPVMLSTLEDGKIVKGLEGIPNKGPTILVGYHMLLGLELGPLVTTFLSKRGILLRGIAHPFMFNRTSEQLMPDSASFDLYRIMGAVPVSATNLYRLLSQKCFVLLYPGGAREALHRKVIFNLSNYFVRSLYNWLFWSKLLFICFPLWLLVSKKILKIYYITLGLPMCNFLYIKARVTQCIF